MAYQQQTNLSTRGLEDSLQAEADRRVKRAYYDLWFTGLRVTAIPLPVEEIDEISERIAWL